LTHNPYKTEKKEEKKCVGVYLCNDWVLYPKKTLQKGDWTATMAIWMVQLCEGEQKIIEK
jgi:hypothetical protein